MAIVASRAKKVGVFFRMSRAARSRATSFVKAAIPARPARICPFPGKAVAGVAVSSGIQRRSTLFATPSSRAACATAKPRSATSLAVAILNSRLNLPLVISNLQFLDQDHIFVSTKPAEAHGDGTTTTSGPTARPDATSRSPCIIPMAQPACHRERAGKIRLPAIQGGVARAEIGAAGRSGAVQNGPFSFVSSVHATRKHYLRSPLVKGWSTNIQPLREDF